MLEYVHEEMYYMIVQLYMKYLNLWDKLKGYQEINQKKKYYKHRTLHHQSKIKQIHKYFKQWKQRKLSLALAFIGGSSIIFLDEPTSGMDTISKRVIWQILENAKKQDRTLVLITHHLHEAEALADRLLTCGRSEYISDMFPINYMQIIGRQQKKIMCSNALIGGPSIQFFDVPKVDPIAILLKTLKMGVKLRKSTVVITMHTMEEAESLCDKIAILMAYCLSSPQELRNRFGNGYNLIIKCHKKRKLY